MTPKDRWMNEGMTVLREKGIAGVRVDGIAARLKLTKGSFHHHFTGIDDYRRALLKRYEDDAVATIEHAKTAIRDLSPRASARRVANPSSCRSAT